MARRLGRFFWPWNGLWHVRKGSARDDSVACIQGVADEQVRFTEPRPRRRPYATTKKIVQKKMIIIKKMFLIERDITRFYGVALENFLKKIL